MSYYHVCVMLLYGITNILGSSLFRGLDVVLCINFQAIFLNQSDSAYEVDCDAYMNPVVHPNDIHWLLSNGNYTHSLQNETKYFK